MAGEPEIIERKFVCPTGTGPTLVNGNERNERLLLLVSMLGGGKSSTREEFLFPVVGVGMDLIVSLLCSFVY